MVGKTLLHYEILQKLGAGGMAEVYKARDTKLNREIALKVLPAESALDPDRRMRFEREAQAVAALKHPNIVTVFSVEQSDGTHFLTMELVEGETLSEHIPERGLSIEKFFDFAVPLADAVSSAHAKGITHRDLKPVNIMLDTEGRLKVLDFGLAKLLETAPSAQAATISNQISATQEGRVLGTANYMSPEQAEGKPVDHRTDIFSLGIILYELATGERPFKGDTNMSTLSSIIKETPAPITDLKGSLPRHLNRIIQHCLAKSPDKRYQSALDVRNDLETLQNEVASGEHTGEIEAARTPAISIRIPWRAVGLFAAGLLVGAGALVLAPLSTTTTSSSGSVEGVVRFSILAPPGQIMLGYRVSPDGQTIAYGARNTNAEEGGAKTYLRRLDSEEPRLIEGSEGAAIGAFSPDSRWYAFVGPISPGSSTIRLFKVPVDGEASPLGIADWPDLVNRGIVWLEGDRIVASNFDGESWFLFPTDGNGTPSELVLDLGDTKGVFPRNLLPDGRHVLGLSQIFEEGSYRHDIALVDLETGAAKVIIRSGSMFRWSPTGNIVFSREDKVLAVPFDLEKLEVTGGPVTVADGAKTSWAWIGAPFDLSRTGTLVYVPGGVTARNRRMIIVDREGAVENWGEPRPFAGGLTVSSDGRYLAAQLDANMNGIWELWISEVNHPRLRMFASVPDMDCAVPNWSTDGERLVYTTANTERAVIYVASRDGSSEPMAIMEASPPYILSVGFTTDGEDVFVGQFDPETEKLNILRVPCDTTRATPDPLFSIQFTLNLSLSPDARWLAYESAESGKNEIYVREIHGDRVGPARQVSEDGGGGPVSWRRTGADTFELVYVKTGRVMSADLAMGSSGLRISNPRDLGIDLVALRAMSGDMLPDGRFLITQAAEESRSTRLNVVLNFHEEIRRRTGSSE